jgi:hypothetical protein
MTAQAVTSPSRQALNWENWGFMLTLPRKQLLAGVFCILLGAFVSWRGYDYSIGTLSNIGAGFFPFMLGAILMLCGIGVSLQALRNLDSSITIAIRPYLMIPGALPAVFLTTLVASFASGKSRIWETLVLAGVLVALVYVIFILILHIPLDPVMWRL